MLIITSVPQRNIMGGEFMVKAKGDMADGGPRADFRTLENIFASKKKIN